MTNDTITKDPLEAYDPMSYAETHCRQCAMGWTRIGIEGGVRIVCLLDRESVLADMTFCDRYEYKLEQLQRTPSKGSA